MDRRAQFKKGMKVSMTKKSDKIYSKTNHKNECIGEITDLGIYSATIKIISHKHQFCVGREFNVGLSYLVPLSKKEKSKVMDIEILLKGDNTKAIIGDKVGIAKRNSDIDEYSEEFGILLSVARALKMDEDFIDELIDLYFDGAKNIEDFTSEDLIEELKSRLL